MVTTACDCSTYLRLLLLLASAYVRSPAVWLNVAVIPFSLWCCDVRPRTTHAATHRHGGRYVDAPTHQRGMMLIFQCQREHACAQVRHR